MSNLVSAARNTVDSIRNIYARGATDTIPDVNDVRKAVIPYYLYKPPFGRPRGIDAIEIRNIASSTYVESVHNTIIQSVCSMDWEIVPNTLPNQKRRERNDNPFNVSENDIDDATYFFQDPNDNHDDIQTLMRKSTRDILQHDAGVFNKIYTRRSYDELVTRLAVYGANDAIQFYQSGNLKPMGEREISQLDVYDGLTFTKDPDPYGTIPERLGYWQYFWSTAAIPIGFNRDEIMWVEQRPRTWSPYGVSPLEDLKNTLYALIFGEKVYHEYFKHNNVPPGVISLINASKTDVNAFAARMQSLLRQYDSKLDLTRRLFHKLPVVNQEVKFTPFMIPPAELEWLGQQKWFLQLVWMYHGVTPSEMGQTENSNKATDISQNRTYKRKAIRPLLDLYEQYFTYQVLSEFGFNKRKVMGRTLFIPTMRFKFTGFDLDEESQKQKMLESKLRTGLTTINEIRTDEGKETVEWGDTPFRSGGGMGPELTGEFDKFIPNPEETQDKKALTTTAGGVVATPRPALLPEAMNTPEKAEDAFTGVLQDFLRATENDMLSELETIETSDKLSEIKAINTLSLVEGLVARLKAMIDPASLSILTTLAISKSYEFGMKDASKQLKMPFTPNAGAIDFIKNYTFENIKDMTDELANDLRGVLERGLLNGEPPRKMATEIKKVFDTTQGRANAIARTETNRAFGQGALDGYIQSGLDGVKEWKAHDDDVTSPICRRNGLSTGKRSGGQTAELTEQFEDPKTGKKFMTNPFHVNCRSRIIFKAKPKPRYSEAEKKAIKHWALDPTIGMTWIAKTLNRNKASMYKFMDRENIPLNAKLIDQDMGEA